LKIFFESNFWKEKKKKKTFNQETHGVIGILEVLSLNEVVVNKWFRRKLVM
jgi:hypothetical protein